MDKDSKAGSSLFGGNGMIAMLLVAAGAFALREVPLEGARPAANEPRIDQRFAAQDIDARLWQDPFGAIERMREDAAKKLSAGDRKDETARRSDHHLAADLAQRLAAPSAAAPQKVTVIAAMLSGGPYAEYVESRRRTRYAVLAGLNAAGYAPVNTEHLGYFRPSGNERIPRDLPETVPFEWFEPSPDNPPCAACRVLVLWVDNDALYQQPFSRLKRLLAGIAPPADALPRVAWRVLGPVGSDGLRAMLDEAAAPDFDHQLYAGFDIRFVSPSATVADEALLAPYRDTPGAASVGDTAAQPSLAAFMAARNISLLRTSGDDRRLADALIAELTRRGLDSRVEGGMPAGREAQRERRRALCRAETQPKGAPDHIAVVAEWDTLYGRSLRRGFMIDAQGEGFCVDRYTYVRGLDGQLPDRGSTPTQAAATGKDAAGAKDDGRRKDGSFVERAEGQSQFDYLRRLAGRLHERDSELRAAGAHGIRAIGVLGNDVHDKLLVMQALQPEFPNALFFTTDLDARMLHPREQPWARNLIVASNYGLRLADGLQSGTPPFRDTYQTATFFATRLAVTGATGAASLQPKVDGWLATPRVFEIGRTSAFDFSARLDAPARQAQRSTCRGDTLEACSDIHPDGTPRYPQVPTLAMAFAASALMVLCWAPWLALSRSLRRRLRRFAAGTAVATADTATTGRTRTGRWPRLALLGGVLALLHVGVPWFAATHWTRWADALTQGGKPISFDEGISIWPTEAIYLFTLLLCVYLVFRGWTALARNLDEITLALRLGRTRRQLIAEQDAQDRQLTRWQRIANMFSLRGMYAAEAPAQPATTDPGMTQGTLAFWKRYIVQNRTSSRLVRSAAATAVMVAFGMALRYAIGQEQGIPVRGDLSIGVHLTLAIAAVVVMTFLVFYVADATLICVRFVGALRMHRANWPQRTLNHFGARLGALPQRLLDHWIDLQFAARRTKSVTGLIYYPFIVLSLLLASRSPSFDDWHMPVALLVMSAVSIGIVLACAVALRWSAEASRRQALVEVRDAMLRATARDAQGQPAPAQLDLLRRQIEELRVGAFAPFSQQPLLKAVLLPFATLGGTSLLDFLAMANV